MEWPRDGRMLSRVGEGTIALEGKELKLYRQCLSSLVRATADGERISAQAVEAAFQDAIFAAIDIRGRRSPDVTARCDEALLELRRRLEQPLQRFRVVVPVSGLADEGLPATFGNVQFAKFDEAQLALFREAMARHNVSEDAKQQRLALVDEWAQSEELRGTVVAVVEVEAVEWGAAEARALREIRRTLDVINFFSDLVPYNHGHLRLPGDGPRAKLAVLQLCHSDGGWGDFHERRSWVGGLGDVSLRKFTEYDERRQIGFVYASQLLTPSRSALADHLVASLQWAGRATVDSRPEEAFLLYAIALESFVLAEGDLGELTYRLKLRVAHLLGGDAERRREIFAHVGRLYKVRSSIVHSGRYHVTSEDLGLMRWLTKACLVRACTLEELTRMTTTGDLVEWFQSRLLG